MNIKVKIMTPSKLLKKELTVPEYQRFYVWNQDKIEELIDDLKYFFENNKEDHNKYYLGTILIHLETKKNTNKKIYNIIDGQQRIISLLIIDYVLRKKRFPIKAEFNSKITLKNINNNFKYICSKSIKNILPKNFLNKISFTVIYTKSEDDAFTFFDTQNGRGVNLAAVDYLKAYHLRAIKNTDLLNDTAQKWDKNNRIKKDNESNNLNILFYNILWRARKWKGNNLYFENKDEILKEFQKHTDKNWDIDKIRYCYQINSLSDFNNNQDKSCIQENIIDIIRNDNEKDYCFMLRQPIVEGINFFLYTNKYNAVYDYLFNLPKNDDKQFQYFDNLYNCVYKNKISNYFKYFFELLCVVYYDKFGENNFLKFALYCDYLIGNHRIIKKKIYKESIIKIIKDSSENIIDVIFMAFDTEDVLSFIKDNTPEIDKNSEITYEGVIGEYRKSYINFINTIGINLKNDLDKENIISKIIEISNKL
ncbi:DUF262 domain-containing protein [Brachyspira hampsonii]|uniref:Uncharacterized protein n=1 Tax=Brachyspira hampsonii 30446 TaxID=1289135 RepID=A0A2U4FKQ6_9SPIR|nr:DUF262 domain-containing protein [Brachyspira hampsonii]EKV57971.1 hypothetical protein A966_02541 [Brachyspira hampsonii 30446]MBW5391068.1 DUF262 domain-containing protein [Brachyspira hampsonii]MBW5395370.1 DUF262 domain-containing protein [Brachyspira hampsonii]OEJ14550.1 hypothetical protein A9495_09935 [Brachyspira hampsonii]